MTAPALSVLRFGDVEIDIQEGRILRGGSEEHLRQKVFHVLRYLIEHRDRAVSKEELMAEVWSDTAVTDDAVVQCIVDLRRALGDDARNPIFIRTVPKRGYRFVAPATAPNTLELTASETIELEIVDDGVSARHKLQTLVVPALAVAVAVLSAAVWFTARGSLEARQRLVAATPIDSPTTSGEALRLYDEGVRLTEAWKPREAIDAFEKALKIDPQFVMARARIGYVHGILGYHAQDARPHIEQALAMTGHATEHERQQIEAWRDIVYGRYPQAIDKYRLIIERSPTDIESHRILAKLLAGEEQLEQSIEVLERARAIDPRSPQILNALGAYSLISRHDEAIDALRKYVGVAPSEANAWDSLALAYQWAGRYDEALDAYARALELRPDFTIVHFHRAGVYVQLGRFRDAIADLQQALNLARDRTERARAYMTMAEVHRIRGDRATMLSAESLIAPASGWEPALTRIEADPAGWRNNAEVWSNMGAYAGRGMRITRRNALYYTGYAALRQGRTEEALDMYRRAVRLQPLTWYVDPFETILADALRDLGRFAEAADEYRRVLGINANYARARFGLAQSLDGLGRTSEARGEYARFIDLWKNADPDARDLVVAKKRLASIR